MPAIPTDLARLIDTKEASGITRVSIRTLRRLADAGDCPPPIRVGRCLRWRLGDLVAWIDAGCPKGRTA
jgi:predicted DNA-binding transcriptional regulator AlpA